MRPDAPLVFALRYAALGWPLFPVWPAVGPEDVTTLPSPRESGDDGDELQHAARCACPKGDACESPAKHPIGKLAPRGAHDATTDEQTIRSWWAARPDASIGLTLAGLLVVDGDPRNGGDRMLAELVSTHGPLPPTPHTFTGGTGDHWFLAGVAFEVKGKPWPGVDIKTGPGAYVVAPPSRHASGARYTWGPAPWEVRPAALPPWLAALLAKPTEPAARPAGGRPEVRVKASIYARRAIESACRRFFEAPHGTRSDLANKEAFELARFVKSGEVSAHELVTELVAAARSAGWANLAKTADTIARGVRDGACA